MKIIILNGDEATTHFQALGIEGHWIVLPTRPSSSFSTSKYQKIEKEMKEGRERLKNTEHHGDPSHVR